MSGPHHSVCARMSEIFREIEKIENSRKLSREKKQEKTSPLYLKLTYLRECGSEFIN
jgi:hypothetical protein